MMVVVGKRLLLNDGLRVVSLMSALHDLGIH